MRSGRDGDQVDLGKGNDEVEDIDVVDEGAPNVLVGGEGNDTLEEGRPTTVEGQGGDYTMTGTGGLDQFEGGPTDRGDHGTDRSRRLAAAPARVQGRTREEPRWFETPKGGPERRPRGGRRANEIGSFQTGRGDDMVRGGAGPDRLLGDEADVIDYSTAPGPISVDPAGSTTDGQGSTDTIPGYTGIRGTPYDDVIHTQRAGHPDTQGRLEPRREPTGQHPPSPAAGEGSVGGRATTTGTAPGCADGVENLLSNGKGDVLVGTTANGCDRTGVAAPRRRGRRRRSSGLAAAH